MLKRLRGNPLPRHAHIEVSGGCQLACPYCSADLRKSKRGKMTAEQFSSVLDKIPSLKSVTLTLMNEPLLNNELTNLVLEAKKRGIRVGFPTNGVTFPDKLQTALLKAGLDNIAFSIDSMDPAVFKSLRYPGDLNVVLTNLRAFIKKKQELGASTKVMIVAVLNKSLLEDLPSFIKESLALGVDKVQFRFPHQWTEYGDEEVEAVSIANALQLLEKAKSSYGSKIEYYHHPNSFSKVGCSRVFNSTAIKVDGHVVPCCLQASDPRRHTLGNVYEESFSTIWDNKKYQDFRSPFLEGKSPDPCKGCTVLSGLNDNPGHTVSSVIIDRMIAHFLKIGIARKQILGVLQKIPL